MTGYGRAEATYATRRYLVEIKSVNNRFCDISVRMPRGYAVLETKIREKITERLVRGKIDIFVTIEDVGDGNSTVEMNEGLAKAYSDAVRKIAELTGREDNSDAYQIARFPDVLVARSTSLTPEEAGAELLPVLDAAIDDILKMRGIEGEKLVNDLLEKVNSFESMHAAVKLRAPLVPGTGSIGKRLDFILQEMNREVNTIGSKANDLTITNYVLDMKTELEKIREQIQNLA